jgi:predicted nuclease with TOPRIM domain
VTHDIKRELESKTVEVELLNTKLHKLNSSKIKVDSELEKATIEINKLNDLIEHYKLTVSLKTDELKADMAKEQARAKTEEQEHKTERAKTQQKESKWKATAGILSASVAIITTVIVIYNNTTKK